jgi:hypothetical protein
LSVQGWLAIVQGFLRIVHGFSPGIPGFLRIVQGFSWGIPGILLIFPESFMFVISDFIKIPASLWIVPGLSGVGKYFIRTSKENIAILKPILTTLAPTGKVVPAEQAVHSGWK